MVTFKMEVFDTIEQAEDYLNRKQVNLDKINICFSGRQILITIQDGECASVEKSANSYGVKDTLGTLRLNHSPDEFYGKDGTYEMEYFNKNGEWIAPNNLINIGLSTPVLEKRNVRDGLWHIILDTTSVGVIYQGSW